MEYFLSGCPSLHLGLTLKLRASDKMDFYKKDKLCHQRKGKGQYEGPHYNIQHGTYLYFILLFICPVCMLICRAGVDTALNKVPMSICK